MDVILIRLAFWTQLTEACSSFMKYFLSVLIGSSITYTGAKFILTLNRPGQGAHGTR